MHRVDHGQCAGEGTAGVAVIAGQHHGAGDAERLDGGECCGRLRADAVPEGDESHQIAGAGDEEH
jgi:hypothetical protein